jgi:DNA primase large subunit
MLIAEALDWSRKSRKIQEKKGLYRSTITEALPKELFPPCVKNILEGLPDGKKRSLFILSTFLRSVRWGWPEVEREIAEWNQRNRPPLKDNYVRGQVRWHRSQKREILPPGCQNSGWYESFGVCKPDIWCGGSSKNVKNPVNYPMRRMEASKEEAKKKPARKRGPPRV